MGGLTGCLLVTDSHCHLRSAVSPPDAAIVPDGMELPFACSINNAVLCGTHPDIDWSLIEAAAELPDGQFSSTESSPKALGRVVIPGFGVHPWFVPHDEPPPPPGDISGGFSMASSACGCSRDLVNGVPAAGRGRNAEGLLHLLEDFLQRYPRAIVGEIGLDKLRGPPEEVQLSLFLAQMKLAARYSRPASVHCVRSFGVMLKALQDLSAEETPPAIVLHGFTGSLEFVKSVTTMRKRRSTSSHGCRSLPKAEPLPIFFGVGAATSLRVKGFLTQTLPFLLQKGRVLLESDAHHTFLGGDSAETGGSGRGGGLHWNATGCMQLAQLIARVSGGDAAAAETLLSGCEETFAQAFRRS